ncbi:UNVERIFIED_CONTAM: hypothetical protein RMT77_018034 [Armadillidium vulgare]
MNYTNRFKKRMLQHSSVDKLDCEDNDNSEKHKSIVDKLSNREKASEIFKCIKCDFESKYKKSLVRHMSSKRHMWSKHTNVQPRHYSKCYFATNEKNKQECHSLDCSESNFKSVPKQQFNIQTLEQPNKDELDCEEVGIDNQKSNTKSIKKLFKCSKCDLETKYKNNLVRHMSNKHPDVEPSHRSENDFVTNEKHKLKCPETNFITIPTMLEHSSEDKLDCEENGNENQENDEDKLSNTKDIKKLFRCLKCDFETKHKKSLDRPMSSKKHLYKPPLHCTKCEFTTNEKSKLECHVLSHCETKLLNSSSCDFKTKFTETFDAHLESNHIENSDQDSKSCDNSKLTTDAAQHLEFKTKGKHNIDGRLLTHSFSEQFKYDYQTHIGSSLTNHLAKHKTIGSLVNSKNNINRMEVDTNSCREHLVKTSSESSGCNFKTKRKSTIVSHKSQHPRKPERDFEGFEKDQENSHIFSHSKAKAVQCSNSDAECEADLRNVREEHKHKTGTRWYHCSKCNFKANNKRFLDSHLRTHYETKLVHECSICSYRTVSKQNLKVHMFKHSKFNFKI